MNDFKEISPERLMKITKGSIFTRKAGWFAGFNMLSCKRRREDEPSGRIIAITYKEDNSQLKPYKYVAELYKDEPVLCGVIEWDFAVNAYDDSLVFFGDLPYGR